MGTFVLTIFLTRFFTLSLPWRRMNGKILLTMCWWPTSLWENNKVIYVCSSIFKDLAEKLLTEECGETVSPMSEIFKTVSKLVWKCFFVYQHGMQLQYTPITNVDRKNISDNDISDHVMFSVEKYYYYYKGRGVKKG